MTTTCLMGVVVAAATTLGWGAAETLPPVNANGAATAAVAARTADPAKAARRRRCDFAIPSLPLVS